MGGDRHRRAAIFVLISGLSLGGGCASQVAPTGGPQDTVPPEIVSTSPSPGALNFRETNIVLEFSEYVDRRSFQESAFLSPSPGALRYEWGGSEVEISFAETLRPNTTYILTVGTDLKDTRNNRLAETFNLPFSSGGTIDSCS
ncbi:MAG TPA: Ig-like domain-containing protein, partial [Bacteroidota bacterium]|nr:Ig-like domain-containing protein [Bacteroidota bacterium]